MILYHGSKSGISGAIRPVSRQNCDFGSGFYMGDDILQAASLVYGFPKALVYTLRVEIPEDARILRLDGRDWLFAVLSYRRSVKGFEALQTAKQFRECIDSCDLAAGKIADDKMREAMRRFSRNGMTDEALYACLASVPYGNQYVAKSDMLCSGISVLDKKPVDKKSFPSLEEFMRQRREESVDIVDRMTDKYLHKGLYLSDIVSGEKKKEGGIGDDER